MAETRKLRKLTVVNKFFDGYKRTSFRFNNGWKDDEQHEYVGKFRILKRKAIAATENDASYGGADGRLITILAPKGVSKNDVINVIENTFTLHCRCEHDCCGHLLSGVHSIRRTKKREWLVEQSRSYNV